MSAAYTNYTDSECIEAVANLEEFLGRENCIGLCHMAIACGSTQEAMHYAPNLDKFNFNAEQQACINELLSKAIEGYRRANKTITGHSLN